SLIRRLHNESVLEGKEEMTPGIQIREWPVAETDIKARFWDFGGQVMSHSTHQFFLRERCLYVLVVDAGSEREVRENQTANDQAEYWLEHVKNFGNGAPVMIVGNKSDITAINLDMNALQENYPNILEYYPVSCISQEPRFISRFNVFRDDLSEQLKAVGTHQVMFTPNQFDVLKKVQQLSRKNAFLDYDEFDGLCKQYEIGKVGLDQQAFLGLLDSLGEIIHFPKLEWSDAYVLNPRWLTYGVYTLLYSDKAKTQQGVLSHADVISILQAQTVMDENGNQLAYPKEKCRFIIDAMSNFKLCYCLSEGSRYFVIPDKLPKEQPNLSGFYDKNAVGTLAFEFDFSGFLPRNIMPNIIVSRHKEIVQNKQPFLAYAGATSILHNFGKKIFGNASANSSHSKYQQKFLGKQLVWQRGVILHNHRQQATACLQVDYHKRTLKLWIQGDEAREYLVILRDEIYSILNEIKGLSVEENVI
ncbi:MAG: hypothetical protein KAJ63_11245, partial [Methyloprofundus sp.]|nr:hypothetical protein [Methyloprofundus sp.]